jgi:lysophospholipase L1-like esterase
MNFTRRTFLNQAALTVGGIVSVPAIVSAAIPEMPPRKQLLFSQNGTILFQGDSITDAGREKEKQLPNSADSFGKGYAFIIGAGLLDLFSHMNISVFNRGISGNKVYQLAERWQKDCLDLKPDLLSILIGINDYWHMRNGKYDGTVERYETDYRQLLKLTKETLPNINLVICQPFALPGTTAVDDTWVEPVKAYQDVALKLSKEFKAIWVPFQQVFDEAIKHAPAKYWAADGVHPSMAGAHLMASAWGKTVLGIEL